MQPFPQPIAVCARHRAFTLVELLVVVAIVGLLVALLMPTIQSARESARRSACQNNLRQIGLALHAHHDLHGVLPRGGLLPPAAGLSWTSATLPFLEEQALFDRLDKKVVYTDAANRAWGKTVLPSLICPSSPRNSLYRPTADLPSSSGVQYARTDYSAMNGERALRAKNATNNPERGAMLFKRALPLSAITDGTSKTILIGEAPEGMHGVWISTRNLLDQSAPINKAATTAKQYIFHDFGQELSSHHFGGAFAAFADGSVHFLSETMENRTLAALCSRAGGEMLEDWP